MLKLEFLFRRGINRDAQHVAGKHVARKLQALELAVETPGNGMRQGSFADSRNPLNQQVATGKQANQSEPNHMVLSTDDRPQRAFQLNDALGSDLDRRSHYRD